MGQKSGLWLSVLFVLCFLSLVQCLLGLEIKRYADIGVMIYGRPLTSEETGDITEKFRDISLSSVSNRYPNAYIEYLGRGEMITVYTCQQSFQRIASIRVLYGSFLLDAKDASAQSYVVIDDKLAGQLMGVVDCVGETVTLNGRPYQVGGVYRREKEWLGTGAARDTYAIYVHVASGADFGLCTEGALVFRARPEKTALLLGGMERTMPGSEKQVNIDVLAQGALMWMQLSWVLLLALVCLWLAMEWKMSAGLAIGSLGVEALLPGVLLLFLGWWLGSMVSFRLAIDPRMIPPTLMRGKWTQTMEEWQLLVQNGQVSGGIFFGKVNALGRWIRGLAWISAGASGLLFLFSWCLKKVANKPSLR